MIFVNTIFEIFEKNYVFWGEGGVKILWKIWQKKSGDEAFSTLITALPSTIFRKSCSLSSIFSQFFFICLNWVCKMILSFYLLTVSRVSYPSSLPSRSYNIKITAISIRLKMADNFATNNTDRNTSIIFKNQRETYKVWRHRPVNLFKMSQPSPQTTVLMGVWIRLKRNLGCRPDGCRLN